MRVVICAGTKTNNILIVVEKMLKSSGVDFISLQYIDEIENMFVRGEYFDRAILVEQSWTKDDRENNEISIREQLNNFANSMISQNTNKNSDYVFLSMSHWMATIVSEEILPIRSKSELVVKEPPYRANLFKALVLSELGHFPEEIMYKPENIVSNDSTLNVEGYEDNNKNTISTEDLTPNNEIESLDDFEYNGGFSGDEQNDDLNLSYSTDSQENTPSGTSDDFSGDFSDSSEFSSDFSDLSGGSDSSEFSDDFSDFSDDFSDSSEFSSDFSDLSGGSDSSEFSDDFSDFSDNSDFSDDSSDSSEFSDDFSGDSNFPDEFSDDSDFPDEFSGDFSDGSEFSDDFSGDSNFPDELSDNFSDAISSDFQEELSDESDFSDNIPSDFSSDFGFPSDASSDFQREISGDSDFPGDSDFLGDSDFPGDLQKDFEDDQYSDFETPEYSQDYLSPGQEPQEYIQKDSLPNSKFQKDLSFDTESFNEGIDNDLVSDSTQGLNLEIEEQHDSTFVDGAQNIGDLSDSFDDMYGRQENQVGNNYFDNNDYADNKPVIQDELDNDDTNNNSNSKGRIKGILKSKANDNSNNNPKADIKNFKSAFKAFANRGNSIVVTGCGGCGTSTIAMNLANIICNMGYTVLLVDMDTRNKTQSYISKEHFDAVDVDSAPVMAAVNSSSGINSYISIIRQGFHLLTMGMASDAKDADEAFKKDRISRFINMAKSSHNFVIYDVPFLDAVGHLDQVIYTADNIVLTIDYSNWGITKTLLAMCNIGSDDMEETIFGRAQILFNKCKPIKKVLGKKVKRPEDIVKVMDNKIMELAGEDIGYYFSNMFICGAIPFDDEFESGWFNDVQYSDSTKGSKLFVDLLKNIVLQSN